MASKCRLRNIFKGMKKRCYNKNCSCYDRYGERGITICDEWLFDIKKFLSWSKDNGYKDSLVIDRINNDGNYEPYNCRWVTNEENSKNKSNSINFTIDGIQMNLKDIAKKYSIPYTALYKRLSKGATIDEAIKKDYKKIYFSKTLDRYTKLINITSGNLKVIGVQINEDNIRLEATCSCGAIGYYKKTAFLESKSCGSRECIKKLNLDNKKNGISTSHRFVKK